MPCIISFYSLANASNVYLMFLTLLDSKWPQRAPREITNRRRVRSTRKSRISVTTKHYPIERENREDVK